MQMSLLDESGYVTPQLEVSPIAHLPDKFRSQLDRAGLSKLSDQVQVWSCDASTSQLRYATHGLFRFFGKFPPYVGSYLIGQYAQADSVVLDPMCGSGTSGVEALLAKRRAILCDVNPLATLISKVKTTHIQGDVLRESLGEFVAYLQSLPRSRSYDRDTPGLLRPEHWFLPATITSLSRLRFAVEHFETSDDVKAVLELALAGVVRRVSRATTQQGRLFLDVSTAVEDAAPVFITRLSGMVEPISALPRVPRPKVVTRSADALRGLVESPDLIICHPPYYNSYRYSAINSLEMAWLRMDRRALKGLEVREAFKVGKPEKVAEYVDDMVRVINSLGDLLTPKGVIALMIGDTILRGEYVPVTRMILDRVAGLPVSLVALRMPRFTEASWVASQRRDGSKVGVTLADFIVVLSKS